MSEFLRLFLPNRAGWFFILLLGLFLFGRPYLLLGDGGALRHILTGQYFLEHGVLPTTNYIDAIVPNRAWLTNSFVADVVYGVADKLFNLNGVVLVAALAIALALSLSYQISRQRGLGSLIGLLILCVATLVTSMHWSARPHVLTYVFFLVSYYLVFVAPLSKRVACIALSLITLVWANVHGSFYLVIVMIGCLLLQDLVSLCTKESAEEKGATKNHLKWDAITLVAALIASTINTRGGGGFLLYIVQFMTNPAVQFRLDEWRNIDFTLGVPVWAYLFLSVFVFTVWTYAPVKPRFGEYVFYCLMFLFGIYAMRIMPYVALLSLPVVAPQWQAWKEQLLSRQHSSSDTVPFFINLLSSENRIDVQEPNSLKATAIVSIIGLIGSLIFLFQPRFAVTDFDPKQLPVSCSNYLLENKIDGLGFAPDNWGGYLYWKLRKPIFIDDYTDLYPTELINDYTAIYYTYPGWKKTFDKYNFKYVLGYHGLPLTLLLAADPQWKKVCEDEASVLFLRNNTASIKP